MQQQGGTTDEELMFHLEKNLVFRKGFSILYRAIARNASL
ncbi:hypothetical protein AVDCRST_MAG94-659 [uncultured Leptolyngbya sp.]|uniref:Uncharacterized protein n=1 Tax=uncultured Leptolyngbya sp. TaxID=332963 RepID=A0A6J4KGV5_9CYAN|nr:hypothetical protein AVDCRST_MAG94-659 [uncultured Leptolyngbya sp.]